MVVVLFDVETTVLVEVLYVVVVFVEVLYVVVVLVEVLSLIHI